MTTVLEVPEKEQKRPQVRRQEKPAEPPKKQTAKEKLQNLRDNTPVGKTKPLFF